MRVTTGGHHLVTTGPTMYLLADGGETSRDLTPPRILCLRAARTLRVRHIVAVPRWTQRLHRTLWRGSRAKSGQGDFMGPSRVERERYHSGISWIAALRKSSEFDDRAIIAGERGRIINDWLRHLLFGLTTIADAIPTAPGGRRQKFWPVSSAARSPFA